VKSVVFILAFSHVRFLYSIPGMGIALKVNFKTTDYIDFIDP